MKGSSFALTFVLAALAITSLDRMAMANENEKVLQGGKIVAFAFQGFPPQAVDAHVAQGAERSLAVSARSNDCFLNVGDDVTATDELFVGFDATTQG